ncbi:hypothetical protein B0H21DRAFT_737476 [Amylocystis lapponica]|nr:hypothetical protein B0H21DRAFT_737476 [Amylocystis lapponica]
MPSQQHTPNVPSHLDDDVKAPYDDLIDQYATSYKTYTVEPSAFDPSKDGHGHTPSYSLSHKQSRPSDVSSNDIKVHEDENAPRLDWEYPPKPPKQEVAKPSLWETIVPDSIACRLYVLTVVVETAIDLAIEAELVVRVQQIGHDTSSGDVSNRKMTVYLSIFALAHVFQFIMALDAVYARNTLQFICLTIFNALFLVYAIIQIGEIQSSLPPNTHGFSSIPVEVLTTVIPCVISVAELAYIALGWKIYTEFGWKVYKFLGADRRIKSMYAYYQIFLCLVKFDVFFWVGFSVQFIWLVLNSNDAEYYLTCAALPLSIAVLVLGHLAARREHKPMMMVFMTGCVAAMVYFMYKLVKVLRFKDTPTFILVWKTLTTFSMIAIILLLITFVFAFVVMNNFGRGLKTRVGNHLQGGKSQDFHHRGPMSTHPNRMSIE